MRVSLCAVSENIGRQGCVSYNNMMLLALVLALLPQDLPGAKTFEKASVKIAAIRPERADAKPGDVVKVAFDLEIPRTWHIYPVGRALFGTATLFTFEGAEIAG